jgi:hypothetical protein
VGPLAREEERHILKQIHFLAVLVYNATRSFPLCESNGLVAEIRQRALASGAFLSDALRKNQRVYLTDVLIAVQGHLADLRRCLLTAHLLTYVGRDEFESLEQHALAAQESLLRWQDRLEETEGCHLRAPAAALPTDSTPTPTLPC